MNERTHLDLFSGIGGFALAAKWNGFRTVGFCDNEPYAQAVLRKHWPDVPIHDDIRKVRGELYAGITLLTGGFPCQPFSVAGKQRGKTDDRYLWPEMLRVIREARPAWIVGENVAGIVNMALDQVHADLEAEDYEVETLIIPACAVDASHRRDRCWIVAHSKHNGQSSGSERRGVEEAVRFQSQGSHAPLNSSGAGLLSTTEHDVEDSSRKQLEECLNPGGEAGTHSEPTESDQGVSGAEHVADSISLSERSAHRSQERERVGGREDEDISQRNQVGRNPTDGSQDVADPESIGLQGSRSIGETEGQAGLCGGERGNKELEDVAYPVGQRGCGGNPEGKHAKDVREPSGHSWNNSGGMATWLPEPSVGRVAHGVSNRTHRLKGLGNAIVPQVAAEIIRCIVEVSK